MGYIVVQNNELYHYKYTKREPDGKGGWRYYYDTGRQRNVSGVGKAVYRREAAPVARAISRVDMSNRPRRNAAGNTYTKVSDPHRPWNYESSSSNNSPGVTEDLYKRAVRIKDDLNKKQTRGGQTLSKEEADDLQYYEHVANGEGRNMAAYKQEADKQRKAAAEAKKPINRAKSAVKSISTAAGSAYDKGKKWLSGLFKK